MKKAILIAAALCMSAPAFASKARKASLGTCVSCADDVQDVWTNASRMFGFGDMITVEFGGTSTQPTGAANTYENQTMAEGGIFRSMGDAKWGFYVGHKNSALGLIETVTGFTTNESLTAPFSFFYGSKAGDMSWAGGFTYYTAKREVTSATALEASGMGLRLGARTSAWEAYFNMGLSSKEVKSATDEFKGNSSMQLGGQMNSGDMVYYAEYQTAAGTRTVSATDVKGTLTSYFLGAESKIKSDAANVFYGVKYSMSELKNDATGGSASTTTVTGLPIYMGLEADATSWLTLRGSVSKPVLVDENKTIAGATETKKTGESTPTVTLGAAFKWNKLTVDWTVARNGTATAGTGDLGTDGFGTKASLTYNF